MKKNYTTKQTETFQISARWKDQEGNVYILSKAKFEVKPHVGLEEENEAIISLDETDGIELDLTDGWAHVVVSPDETYPIGTFKFDLLVRREIDDKQRVLIEGDYTIQSGVSNLG